VLPSQLAQQPPGWSAMESKYAPGATPPPENEPAPNSWAYAHALLGSTLAAQGRFGEAEEELIPAARTVVSGYGPNSVMTQEVRARAAALYDACGRPADAAPWR